jgi:flagellar FliL protein
MSPEASKSVSAEQTPGSSKPAATAKNNKSSSSKAIAMALLAALGGGGGVWFFLQRAHTAEASRNIQATSAPKYLVHLDGFTVNLNDPEETHFLRVTMDLGVDRLPEGADREKGTTLLPVARIRDSILSVLTVCKADVLLTSEGKIQLKQNLVKVLNQNVPEVGVRDVYFTEFLVQR